MGTGVADPSPRFGPITDSIESSRLWSTKSVDPFRIVCSRRSKNACPQVADEFSPLFERAGVFSSFLSNLTRMALALIAWRRPLETVPTRWDSRLVCCRFATCNIAKSVSVLPVNRRLRCPLRFHGCLSLRIDRAHRQAGRRKNENNDLNTFHTDTQRRCAIEREMKGKQKKTLGNS